MSLFVKICGLRDAEAVAAAVDAGANAVGFVFAESVRRVAPLAAAALAEAVPASVRRVAVMRHPTNAEWQAVLEAFFPDVLQTDAEDFAGLELPATIERWPVVRQGTGQHNPGPDDTYLYEGADSGTGETVDWSRAAGLAGRGRMILAGGLSPDNVGLAIRQVRPWGVDVSSGVESAPGVKDSARIRQFIDAVRVAEKGA